MLGAKVPPSMAIDILVPQLILLCSSNPTNSNIGEDMVPCQKTAPSP